MASPPPAPMRPPPNYIPNPNPNQNPNLSGSFQNLQISGQVGAPPPATATSGPISRPGPPPAALSRSSFPSNGVPVGPPNGPPSMIRAPLAQSFRGPPPGSPPPNQSFNAPPGRPTSASYMANQNLNPVSQPLQTVPAAAQPNPMIGLPTPQPNSMMGTTASQPFASRPLVSAPQRQVASPFPGSLNQNPMGSRPLPGLPGSQPYSGPPAAPASQSQSVRGPTQLFPGQPFMGQPPMGQPSVGQPPMGLQPMSQPSMAPPFMGAPPMGAPAGSAASPFGAHAWQTQQRPVGFASD